MECQFSHDPSQVAVVMVPLPLQSHLNKLLNLSFVIASYNIPVHYASSTRHNNQVKLRCHVIEPENRIKIQFHDLQLPPFSYYYEPSSHPPPLHRVLPQIRRPVFQLLQELSTTYRKIVVIYDGLMSSVVQDVKSIPNAEAYSFYICPPFSVFCLLWETLPSLVKPFLEIFLEGGFIPRCTVPSLYNPYVASTKELRLFIIREFILSFSFEAGRLYDTNRLLDEKYMNLIATTVGLIVMSLRRLFSQSSNGVHREVKDFALGPFNPVPQNVKPDTSSSATGLQQHKCLDWLDQHEENSVIYVSFGTQVSMSHDQIHEFAIGLEKSGHKFLWVLRKPDKGDVPEADEAGQVGDDIDVVLPEGFIERVTNRGLVERDWAPQLDILAHPSVGGFMSHCGWGSCIESLSMGVAIAACPMLFDQPSNAVLVTEVLRVGSLVREWEERAGIVTSDKVDSAVKRLMGSAKGERLRRRAVELGRNIRESMAEGGACRLERDAFIAHILANVGSL